jgi:hypothetical protein
MRIFRSVLRARRDAVRFTTDTASRAIVGVGVVNAGSDVNESEPMRKQVEQRTGQKVEAHLMDGGYVGLESIDRASKEGVTICGPVPKPRKAANPYEPRKGDTPEIAAWRLRMGTEEAKAIYKGRALPDAASSRSGGARAAWHC